MDAEHQFWIRLWGFGLILLLSFVGSCTFLEGKKIDAIELAAKSGGDPIATACALRDSSASAPHCIISNRK